MTTITSATPFFTRISLMLRNRDYRHLLLSNVFGWQTLFMEGVVLGWLVLDQTNSAWWVALVGFCRTAPFPICGLLAGPITDRFGRRRVLLIAQTMALVVYLGLTLLLWLGWLTLWHLMVTALLLGTAWGLDWPARGALLPDLVGKAAIVDATAMINLTQNLARILGPAIAGTLVATWGPLGCYAVMGIFAWLAWLNLRQLSVTPLASSAMPTTGSSGQTVMAGLRYVRQSQPILAVMLITVVINWLYFPYLALLPVFARDVLHRGPVALGLLGASTGIGSLLGLFLIDLWRRWSSNGAIFATGTLAMTILLIFFARTTNYELAWLLLFISGICEACFVIMQSSILLLAASDIMRSRVLGTLMLAIGADPVGKLQTGLLASWLGAPTAVTLQTGVAALFLIIITLALPGLRHAQTPQPDAERPDAPHGH
jgi:MFS family permease